MLVDVGSAINPVASASGRIDRVTSRVYKRVLAIVNSVVIDEEFGHAHKIGVRGGKGWTIRSQKPTACVFMAMDSRPRATRSHMRYGGT